MARVLVVDDEFAFAAFAKILLESLGHAPTVCMEPEKAVEMAVAGGPDLILTDLHMPEVDGLELIKRLKARPETASIPVVLVSSSTERSDRAEAARLGALYSIIKPLQKDRLKLLIEQILGLPKK